ncbi:ASIC2 [Bugula neritina]|uniref:ASIC2 n=1 Tax=Bugula neritina TaxID=10212 RepID=A0A7J7IT56_BUGNE|nr:ASIC2 [Bugula neritina]
MTDNQNQSTIEYMRNNHAAVLISYAELSYELIEENLAYPGVDFIANLGGTMGVCLGASLLTLIELLEFIILKITWTISKKINNNSGSVMPIRKVFVS